MTNEHDAHMSLKQGAEQVEQDRIAARKAQIKHNEKIRKQRLNQELMSKLREVLTFIAIAIIAYTLYGVWL